MRLSLVTVFIVMVVMVAPANAHEVRPGYLELRQTDTETFEVFWKVPARGKLKLGIHARLPEICTPISAVVSKKSGGAFMDRWTVTCPGGLSRETISIDGLSGTLTDVLARIERLDGTSQVTRLTPDTPSFIIEAAPKWQQIVGSYLGLGAEHILLGIDHLLFVLALLLLVKGWRQLIATVTAFTVAHSLTLAAATLGYVHVPQRPVEAVIALSIVFLASEIARGNRDGLTYRYPVSVSMSFGLLHGFGFAAVLGEIGLPENEIPTALLFFNVGVEIGQLLFIGALIAVGTVILAVCKRVSGKSLRPVLWQPPGHEAVPRHHRRHPERRP